MTVPDPNRFDGSVGLRRLGGAEWAELPVGAGHLGASRGYGLADLALTAPGREARASGSLALHVLDVMLSVLVAADERRTVPVTSTAVRPEPVPLTGLTVPSE